MAIQAKKTKSTWFTLLILIAAVALWAYDQKNDLTRPSPEPAPSQGDGNAPFSKTSPTNAALPQAGASKRIGRYEVFENCTLVEARNNDGDSFMLRLSNGKTAEFRLYFVDTPESAFKRYGGGETNHARISQQAADLGGITPEQAVEIGKQGKAFTLGLLQSKPITIFTEWDSPYNDGRYHAHVEMTHEGKTRWLHQLLVERGLARIKTKPADLPNGNGVAAEKSNLRRLESEAKRNGIGVWGL